MTDFALKRATSVTGRRICTYVLVVFLSWMMLFGGRAYGQAAVPEEDRAALRAAINDLIRTFGDRYPNGKEYLTRLRNIETANRGEFDELRCEALIANPLVSGQPILF
ncbi:MAG: hypothetical protein P8Z79_26025, partial [Sedimentisphaerales bacterium]